MSSVIAQVRKHHELGAALQGLLGTCYGLCDHGESEDDLDGYGSKNKTRTGSAVTHGGLPGVQVWTTNASGSGLIGIFNVQVYVNFKQGCASISGWCLHCL